MSTRAAQRSESSRSQVQRIPVLPVRDNVHFPNLIGTLLVGREISQRAIHSATSSGRQVLVLGQRDLTVDEPVGEDLFRVGTLSEVVQVMPLPDGTLRVVLRGICRARAVATRLTRGYLRAEFEILLERQATGPKVEALRREALDAINLIASMGKQIPVEVLEILPSIEDVGHLSDLLTDQLNLKQNVKQELLEELDSAKRLEKLIRVLTSERQVLELQSDLRSRVEQELGNTQREYFLREQLKLIQSELSGGEIPFSPENEILAAQILSSGMPEETQEKALSELRRLERAPSNSPETMVIRNWLDWMIALPWSTLSEDRLDVKHAAEILDAHHFGLRKVKDRILDFLAVRQLSGSLRGPILCFVGPPGVGKTSLGKSIAEALGRKFIRVSLGGVRDEAEIRGHRRTYVGSMPGRLIQGVKGCGTRNPVFMLDEIDKMTADFRGDPTSALLEALDPEQNSAFSDHYIEASFDLSAVMFIMTANLEEQIPAPLRDRMEVIHFPSYTEFEKEHIAEQFLVPRLLEEHGLKPAQLAIQHGAIKALIREYTREAGVRNLSREIATVCRKAARGIAEERFKKLKVDPKAIVDLLGHPKYRHGVKGEHDEPNVATGLVYTQVGGDIIDIEVNLMPTQGPEPVITTTGSLGNVMKESALAAVSFVRANQEQFKANRPFTFDVHVHVPEGAVPKDGPSAGITIVTALVSAFTGRPVRKDVAMTGEITLRGKVLPIGGVREKVLAAHRAGILEVILPKDNLNDLDELPEGVRESMRFHGIESVREALDVALA